MSIFKRVGLDCEIMNVVIRKSVCGKICMGYSGRCRRRVILIKEDMGDRRGYLGWLFGKLGVRIGCRVW